ncbi:MAG: hypothetical protein JWP87_5654 [Labilithrix sp.]|nr:hypothetical protein [Labilithrix sp.]
MSSPEPTSPASSGGPSPVREGDILASKYRVEKVLGVGGMGVVVAAEHIELSQKVALKFLLKQASSNDDLVSRFLREARASVRLKGAHVAKTLDVGRLEDGCPYIVMEFLDGHDLHAEIRGGVGLVAVEDAVSYVIQAAEGLAEAHALGIVHRDLKPGNLFLTRGVDGRPLVKVLDFGISKTMDPIGGDGLSLTKTEMLLGSPLYMSPEQMRSSKHVDERSDLWALGAIAFELLTGRVPFEADTILELCFKVAQEKAPNPKDLRPELPDELCAAVMKCLEKDPADRFPNVGELARAFEPFGLPRDRGTAERALDVLGTGKRPPMRSIAPNATTKVPATKAPAPGPSPDATPIAAPKTPAAIAVPQSTPSQIEAVAPAAWGTTQAQTKAKSRRSAVVIGAAVVVLAAIAGTVVASRGGHDGERGAALVGSTAAAPPSAVSAAVAPPSAVAIPSPSVATSPSSSASTSTSAAPAASAPAVVPSTKVVRPAPSASAAKSAKPAPSAAPPPTADPGGFIKVRE